MNLIKITLNKYHKNYPNNIKLSKYWLSFGNSNDIPHNGMKIHISSNIAESFDSLLEVISILCENKWIWKMPNSTNVINYILDPFEIKKISGKVLTIYPRSKEEFYLILKTLEKSNHSAKKHMKIKTDIQYKNTSIYFRKYSGR